jgi:hypothetical protein
MCMRQFRRWGWIIDLLFFFEKIGVILSKFNLELRSRYEVLVTGQLV